MSQEFLSPGEHFDALLAIQPAAVQAEYKSLNHIRQEVCYRGRTFIVYQIENRAPKILANISVMDFVANDMAGASCELRCAETGKIMIVGYEPVKLFDFPVYVHLPLHLKLRWSTTPDRLQYGSLAFDMAVRTKTRSSLRERGAVFCETGVSYAKEFQGFRG